MASTNYFNKGEARARFSRQPNKGLNFQVKKNAQGKLQFELKDVTTKEFKMISVSGSPQQETLKLG